MVRELGAFGSGHRDTHRATVGKLHCIAEEIDENLLDAYGVAYAQPARAWRHTGKQVDAFGSRTGSKEIDRILHEIDQRKGLKVEFDSARLDLGEIEHVIDDGQQGITAPADGLDEIELFGVQRSVQEQIGHADNGIHWRANLVTHAGEKGALGAIGGIGAQACLLECRLGAFQFVECANLARKEDEDLLLNLVEGLPGEKIVDGNEADDLL